MRWTLIEKYNKLSRRMYKNCVYRPAPDALLVSKPGKQTKIWWYIDRLDRLANVIRL